MFVQEAGHIRWADVFSTFQKPLRQGRDGVGVCLHQIGHDVGELFLVLEVGDPPFPIRQEGREGMNIVVVDASNVGVRHHDEGEVSQCLYAMG